ncbi:pimeloyl-ACP methyl ester carboxylesterase [Kibdelosporangium banguiense]|uniref:Pimeloyl-ACP methyl ester carboxylesterase n=1 Tax=Kibdelosporangium banguiense TaxID=1365924 RepID=A0ABS4TI04_9PSEU|nr:alpha/beta fold hydrolase [Kibdelosporangium banguiense]MBP2323976.1 pimeloyl-ACP methyl ester carboxylesterase [Kibdelosporangium banguiense]
MTVPAATATTADTGTVRCSTVSVPVMLTLLPQTVRGQLCLPADHTPRTVQLLVHGGTYNRTYWDIGDERYSYQRDMAAAGFATFAIDCLGSGQSSQPLSTLLTGTTQAAVVSQVVTKLRSGAVSGTTFDKVILVGHSMGSGIVVVTAATFHGVDGVILTGMTHSMDLLRLTGIFVDGVRPAILDPRLSQRGSDPGYVTTMPGTRGVFHDPGDVTQAIVNADEAVKDQVPATVVPDLISLAFAGPLSAGINVPVLIANGTDDTLFCAFACAGESELRTAEAPYFSPAAQLTVHLTPHAGHSVALSEHAAQHRTAIRNWMSERFGS